MDIVERARAIILNPGPTWTVIEQETTDWQKLYVPYLVVLAAIPALAGFIGWSVVGMGGFGFSMRLPVFTGLSLMVSRYVLTLVMVFVWGWIISLLAPTFGGQSNVMNGVKLTVYGITPAMLAGIFQVLPGLSMLGLLGLGYSLYVVYLGLPVLMKNPPEKSAPYLAVVAVVGIVGALVLGAASNLFMPSPLYRMHGANMGAPGNMQISTPKDDVQISTTPTTANGTAGAAMTIKTPDGEIKIDAQGMEDMAKRLQALAAEQQKAAQQKASQPQ